jgi:hypothetical protein
MGYQRNIERVLISTNLTFPYLLLSFLKLAACEGASKAKAIAKTGNMAADKQVCTI